MQFEAHEKILRGISRYDECFLKCNEEMRQFCTSYVPSRVNTIRTVCIIINKSSKSERRLR